MSLKVSFPALLALATLGPACADATDGEGGGGVGAEVPPHYVFDSRFEAGSSVSYSGQVFRHALVLGLTRHMGALTGRIDSGEFVPATGDVLGELNFFYRFESASSGTLPLGIETEPGTLQVTWDDLSSDKDLQGKIAGQDETGQHKDWSQGIVGWDGSPSPDGLVQEWLGAVDALASQRAEGTIPMDPTGTPIDRVFVSAEGLNYQQLTQKFLLGAVAFSQGVDDYLDDDIDGKGLLSDNVEPDGDGAHYTALEHGWDEGFGYFGPARDYLDYSDDEIAAKAGRPDYASGYHDTDEDGVIDLRAEFNMGHALNAAKRDRGSVAPTDFSGDAMTAFLTGRTIIAGADGALSGDELAELRIQRDIVVQNWEMAIAATVVHYINDVIQDMNAFDTDDYSFASHAEHWSEMKGFALSFQFNRNSPLNPADFAALHQHLGGTPALPGQESIDAYREALLDARTIVGDAYGFDAANLGDRDGEGGW